MIIIISIEKKKKTFSIDIQFLENKKKKSDRGCGSPKQ